MASKITKTILAASVTLISFNAHATLTSYNAEGVDLVYSSVSDVTWLKDANLFATMAASKGMNNFLSELYAVSPTVTSRPNYANSYTGIYNVYAYNYMADGELTWYGATAFVNYLNSINYGGISKWRLPTNTAGIFINNSADAIAAQNGISSGNELAELFYSELGGSRGKRIPDPNNIFDNEQYSRYWTGTESDLDPDDSWRFVTTDGGQGTSYKTTSTWNYAWIVTDGKVAAVPEPGNLAMLLAGLGLLGIAVRRSK